jgi:lipopolysaccharide export system permease protein
MKIRINKVLKSQNSLLAKYLMRQVLVLLAAIFIVIALVIFGNQLVLVFKGSILQNIPSSDLLPIVGLKMIRDVPLILSLSLLLAIILTLNKFYKNSEAVVMNSLGIGDKHFMIFIQPVVLVIFTIILFLTAIAVPWSKHQRNEIIERGKNTSEFAFMKAGEFQQFKNGKLVFYTSKIKKNEGKSAQNMHAIFIYTLVDNEPIITLAAQAQKYTDADNSVYLHLKDGVRYHGFPSDKVKKILNFDAYDLQIIDAKKIQKITNTVKIEAKPTLDLLFSNDIKEIAEWQWRLAQPLSILILSVFGVLLGKTSARGGKNLGVLAGILVFIIYNNALLVAKSSLENGSISPIIGLWWVHLLAIFVVMMLYAYRHGKLSQLIAKPF